MGNLIYKMKSIYNKPLFLVAALAFLNTVNAGTTLCNLKFFEYDQDNWADMASGWLLGLQENPKYNRTTCTKCSEFGNTIGLLNYGFNYVESKREVWINQDEITTIGILEIADTLLQIYTMFLTLLKPIDALL